LEIDCGNVSKFLLHATSYQFLGANTGLIQRQVKASFANKKIKNRAEAKLRAL